MNAAPCRSRGRAAYAESELFTWPSAQLSLVHEKEQALLQTGTFTLLLTHHLRSAHLVVVEASVGDVRWPVGKDCLVITVPGGAHPASSCFLFGLHLPSSHDQLTYQLLLFDHDQASSSSHGLQVSKLQSLLALYATLHMQQPAGPSNSGLAHNALKKLEDAAGEYWVGKVGNKQTEAGQQKGADSTETQSSHANYVNTTSPAGVSKRMMKRMQKARRISAVSKLFSKAVVRGLINAKAHIVHETACESENTISALADTEESGKKPAIANVEAVTKVVEAVEGAGLPQTMVEHSTGDASLHDPGCEAVLDISAMATWTINESGLRLVLNAAEAANKSMQAAVSTGTAAAVARLYSISSSCLTSCDRNSAILATLAVPAGKAVGEFDCRAGSNSSFSSHPAPSSLQSGSTELASSEFPSTRRPPRPPRRVGFHLNEVSSPVSVSFNGNSHTQQ